VTQPVLFAVEDGEHSAVTDGAASLSACDKGDISELAFEMEAQKRGWIVASARGKSKDFDAIIKRPHLIRPVSVQVKLANWAPGGGGKRSQTPCRYAFHCGRVAGPYTATAFDILAVHLADLDKWVFYTRAELGNRRRSSYLPPELRKQAIKFTAPDARDPDNWELLDQVAAMYSQESLSIGQPLSYPPNHNPLIP
jgi:hypothetical protein